MKQIEAQDGKRADMSESLSKKLRVNPVIGGWPKIRIAPAMMSNGVCLSVGSTCANFSREMLACGPPVPTLIKRTCKRLRVPDLRDSDERHIR